jgi:hypothetical protein
MLACSANSLRTCYDTSIVIITDHTQYSGVSML